ncbi:MAG: serine hydrolase [Haliea sp.]|uniref:serine hydrolase domain-containing protein n=1 Tax=Haliea sp. TaxID=1932666 RepID=UPI0032ECD076
MKTPLLVLLRSGLIAILLAPGAANAGQPLVVDDLMQGAPVPPEKRVTLQNFMQEPFSRWGFRHIRQLAPTADIYAGSPISPLESSPVDLDALAFEVGEGRTLDLATWMEESRTDSFLVLHRGRIVYERYLHGMQPQLPHQMFSVTKSFVGTLVLTLAEEGQIDLERTVASYIPELADSAFGSASVQQVLDMVTSVSFSEDYADPEADIWHYGKIVWIGHDPAAAYTGPASMYDYLPTLKPRDAAHGLAFHYVTPNTDVLAWILSRVTGQSLQELIAERLWQPLGAERSGYLWLDRSGVPMAGGGLNITARDAARFGQMILQGGFYNQRQILPPAVVRRILTPRNRDVFNVLYQDDWYDTVAYGYHDQWWSFNNPHKAVSAIGVHGQFIYLDSVADMVVVKQSAHPEAEGESNEVHGPLIWHQIAVHLLGLDRDQ